MRNTNQILENAVFIWFQAENIRFFAENLILGDFEGAKNMVFLAESIVFFCRKYVVTRNEPSHKS